MASEFELVNARLEAIGKDIELLHERSKSSNPTPNKEPKTPWYTRIIQILGIPAAIVAIFIQWGQFNINSESAEKTRAETAKINVEREQLQIELEKKLDELKQSRVNEVSHADVSKTIDSIKDALSQAARLRDAEIKGTLTSVFMKGVIISFLLSAWDIIVSLASLMWSATVVPVYLVLRSSRIAEKITVVRSPYFMAPMMAVSSLVDVFRLYVKFVIIASLLAPVAYEAAAAIGASENLEAISRAARSGHFLSALHHLFTLFGGVA